VMSEWQDKVVEPIRVLSLRKKVGWAEFQPLSTSTFIQVLEYLKSKKLSPHGPIITQTYNVDDDYIDVEICVPLPTQIETTGTTLTYKELRGGSALFKVFEGGYGAVFESYTTLPNTVSSSGKSLKEPIRTIFLVSPVDTLDESKWKTEVQALV